MARKGKKIGRPNSYKNRIEPYLDIIADLRAKGKDDEFIYKLLGVSKSTFYAHKSVIDEFSDLYKAGEDIMLKNVVNSLYDLALGKAVKRTITTRKGADGEVISQDEKIEYLPPDKIAAFFVLTNRMSEDWRHKQEIINDNDEMIEAVKDLTLTINESKWYSVKR